MNSPSQHIDPETLAAFAEGRLDAAKRDAVVAHIDHCHDCMNDVALVMSAATAESQRRRFGRPSWLLALAAALALALPLAWHAMRHGSPTDELVSLSPRSARIVEPRLTGFPWAAYHGPMRAAGGSVTDAERLKLGGAAGELMQRAEHDSSADAQHAAGVAMVLVDKPDEAIAKLESAAKASHDAKSWSDLAAARYAAAVQFRRPSLYPEALAASDDALRIDARLPEALFNRALILENMGLISEARKAWQRYLEVDPGSQWSNEARTHLTELPSTTGASRWERDQPLLESAAASGDARKTLALVDAHRERARRFAEAEYLGRWADAVQHNNDAEAAKWLTISRVIGNALAQLSSESLLRDAVHSIDTADTTTRAKMAEAHVIYRRGRIAFSRDQAQSAERDLRAAASIFESANDPMSLMARHYAAAACLARNDTAAARAELDHLRAEVDTHPGYLALGGQLRWELARACKAEEDWSSEVATLAAAAELFHRAGEKGSEAFVELMLASAQTFLGHPDEAWNAQILALNNEALPDLVETTLGGAVRVEINAGRLDAALALLRVLRSMQRSGTTPVRSIEILVQKAMLEAVTGDSLAAAASTSEAEMIARQLPDAEVKARQMADIDVGRGAQLLISDPRRAEAPLTRAIGFYRSHERLTSLPEPLLLRARCAQRTGRQAVAAQDLEDGIQLLEQHLLRVDNVVLGTGVLDAGNALFADAMRLSLNRGDTARAFSYAERSHGGVVTVTEIQHRLRRSRTAVLEIVMLADEVVTFGVSHDEIQAVRRKVPLSEITSLAERDDADAATALYDILVRPLDSFVARAGALVIVADARLASAPFAALFDSTTRQHLIEKLPVAIASSAASLRDDARGRAPQSVAEIVLPYGATVGSTELPEAEKEIADVASAYPHVTSIPAHRATWSALRAAAASADIVHIAGHTEQQLGVGEQTLLLAGEGSGPADRVSWKTILAAPAFHARVIVLAACETLRGPRSSQSRGLSLGAAFAAGGADVVGTLRPIPDRDARFLFRSLHRHLATGASAASAVRATQLEAIRETTHDTARAWRAIAVFTTHL
jgi:CHAT domain-containing protein/tetratricopeptide (TPR) repeat protein